MLHVRLGHDRAAQAAGTRLGSSAFTIRRRRSIQPIRYPAVVFGQAAAQTEGQRYRILLEKAKDCTHRSPDGQLHGRQGRRSVLEDEVSATGERMLLRCLDQRPSCLEARSLLMDNIMAQGRGREAGVPHMVLDALRRTELRGCKQGSRHAQKALRIIRVGLAALEKLDREGSSNRFMSDVLRLVPDLDGSICEMAHNKRVLTSRQQGVDFNGSRDDE